MTSNERAPGAGMRPGKLILASGTETISLNVEFRGPEDEKRNNNPHGHECGYRVRVNPGQDDKLALVLLAEGQYF